MSPWFCFPEANLLPGIPPSLEPSGVYQLIRGGAHDLRRRKEAKRLSLLGSFERKINENQKREGLSAQHMHTLVTAPLLCDHVIACVEAADSGSAQAPSSRPFHGQHVAKKRSRFVVCRFGFEH